MDGTGEKTANEKRRPLRTTAAAAGVVAAALGSGWKSIAGSQHRSASGNKGTGKSCSLRLDSMGAESRITRPVAAAAQRWRRRKPWPNQPSQDGWFQATGLRTNRGGKVLMANRGNRNSPKTKSQTNWPTVNRMNKKSQVTIRGSTYIRTYVHPRKDLPQSRCQIE